MAERPSDAEFLPIDPLLIAIRDLWQARAAAADALPARESFSLDDLRPFLGRLALVDVRADGFFFRLYGTRLAEDYRDDMTGKPVAAMRPAFRDAILPGYRRAAATRAPVYELVDFIDDWTRYRWERLVLPLAKDGRTVDALLVCSMDLLRAQR